MSAIFGIIDFEGRSINPEWVKSMQADLAHRGPDGQSLYQEESMFMGHMLLQVTPESIYDTSPYEEAGFVITANARLDEREAIMDRLNISQSERDTITDPLLLLRSFLKFGKDFVKDIYGDFAFAIWDKEKKELFCARDQIGVKPFLYYFQDNRFVFSTELKSIVKLPFVETGIDNIYLRNRAIGMDNESNLTNWENIFRLKPANILVYKDNDIVIKQYWTPSYKRSSKYKTEEESALALKKIIEKTVSDRMRVIGEIGIPLSGGLDSSTIACLAAKERSLIGKRVFTTSSMLDPELTEEGDVDEQEFIQTVLTQEKNIDPTLFYHSDLKFTKNIEIQFEHKYAPVNDYHYVDTAIYKQFQSKSVRRVISGYLGDDTASNKTVLPLSQLLLSGRFIAFFKLSKSIRKNMNLTTIKLIKSHILAPIMPMFMIKLLHIIRETEIPWKIDAFPLKLTKIEKIELQKRYKSLWRRYHSNNITDSIWSINTDNFEEEWDCRSSHHLLEISYPFADRRIVEFLMEIPLEHFYAGGLKRGLIRKAMIGVLPEKIRLRQDKGYYSPGYFQIFRNDIYKIRALLECEAIHSQMDGMLEIKKIFLMLENLDKPKNNVNFEKKYYSSHQICLWIVFSKWLLTK